MKNQRTALYLRAAERIQTSENCSCCGAIGDADEVMVFAQWFKPDNVNPDSYWFGRCSCFNDENVSWRVTALCMMATLVEKGEA